MGDLRSDCNEFVKVHGSGSREVWFSQTFSINYRENLMAKESIRFVRLALIRVVVLIIAIAALT